MVGILGANSVSGGYEIDNSLRFNDDDAASLKDTQSAGNRRTWTFSAWLKRSLGGGAAQVIFNSGTNDGNYFVFNFVNDALSWHQYNGSAFEVLESTDAVYRDPSAWYHVVLRCDTTDSTANNRFQLYVNGVLQAHTANTTASENLDTDVNVNGHVFDIGNDDEFNQGYVPYDGYMAEVYLIDGTAKAPTDFGETDDNGVWIPKAYTGTYGTNGFYLEFKQTGTDTDASGMGADTSGNDNHFAVTNLAATDVTTDTPTNNFCTMNPLTQSEVGNSPTFAEGNLKITMTDFDEESVMATMGVTKGKWYWEVKGGWTTSNWGFGIEKSSSSNTGFLVGYTDTSYSFSQAGYKQGAGGSASQIDSGLGNTDIIGYALDLDNGHFNFSQNGVWYNGSATESTTFNTSTHDFTSLDFGNEFAMPTIAGFGDGAITTEINFGNPSFAISSSNADANGYGDFEYAPPSGYYSLCTKNLAEFG